jgi:hypothetical protein
VDLPPVQANSRREWGVLKSAHAACSDVYVLTIGLWIQAHACILMLPGKKGVL